MDVTPSFKDEKEKILFKKLKNCVKKIKKNYNIYKKWCDKYFYIKHRKNQEE